MSSCWRVFLRGQSVDPLLLPVPPNTRVIFLSLYSTRSVSSFFCFFKLSSSRHKSSVILSTHLLVQIHASSCFHPSLKLETSTGVSVPVRSWPSSCAWEKSIESLLSVSLSLPSFSSSDTMELVKKVNDDDLLPFVGYCRAFVVDSDGLQRKTKGQTIQRKKRRAEDRESTARLSDGFSFTHHATALSLLVHSGCSSMEDKRNFLFYREQILSLFAG